LEEVVHKRRLGSWRKLMKLKRKMEEEE